MRIHVEFDLLLPEGVSDAHVQEWLELRLGISGRLTGSNPLRSRNLEAKNLDWDER